MITLIIFCIILKVFGLHLSDGCTDFQLALLFLVATASDLNFFGHLFGGK